MHRSPTQPAMRSATDKWKRPEGVKLHTGAPIPDDAEFFQAPPASIGQVISAQTTLRIGAEPRSLPMRILMGSPWALPGIAMVILAGAQKFEFPWGPFGCAGVVIAICGMVYSFNRTAFRHVCTYVGTLGVARFTLRTSRLHPPTEDGVRFAEVAALYTGIVRTRVNGIPAGASFSFNWTDTQGKSVFAVGQSFHGRRPNPNTQFPFAEAAEAAWSLIALRRAQTELQDNGFAQFNLQPAPAFTKLGDYVRVGPGFLEFCRKKKITRLPRGQINDIKTDNGILIFQDISAGKFIPRRYTFYYRSVANARVFLAMVGRVLDLHVN